MATCVFAKAPPRSPAIRIVAKRQQKTIKTKSVKPHSMIFRIFDQENNKNMTAIELKKVLIHRITEINDMSFLNAIKTILDAKLQSQTITLTSEQRHEIQESKKEIEQGQFIEQAELDKEFNKWLSAR